MERLLLHLPFRSCRQKWTPSSGHEISERTHSANRELFTYHSAFELTSYHRVLDLESYHPALALVVDYLPHVQWPKFRQINKYSKSVVEQKLQRLKKFSYSLPFEERYRPHHFALYRNVYMGLRDAVPNLTELPFSVDSILTHGGFPHLKHLFIDRNGHDANYRLLDELVAEIKRRAPVLESIKFGGKVATCEVICRFLYWKNCFSNLKELNFELIRIDKPIFSIHFPTMFPNLEIISLPNYCFQTLKLNLEIVQRLPAIKQLKFGIRSIETYSLFYTPEIMPPIPQLQKVIFNRIDVYYEFASSWSIMHNLHKFFSGAQNLRAVSFDSSIEDPEILELMALIPTHIYELTIKLTNELDGERLLKFLESRCLERLTFLNIAFDAAFTEAVVRSVNQNLVNIQDLEIQTLPTIRYPESGLLVATEHRLSFELPMLQNLSIEFPYSGGIETVYFEDSGAAKGTLRRFELRRRIPGNGVRPDFPEQLCVHSLLNNFLGGCESLEHISLSGWSDSDMEAIKVGVAELELPRLREVKTQ